MWITDGVDIPDEVLEAHAQGTLVIFVGAGASVDAPSSLPSFAKLAESLAAAAHVPYDPDIAIDLFLGSMPSGFDVHRHAHALITPSGSSFNSTHAAIARVAASSGAFRVVTTNFDDHQSSAALAAGINVGDKWMGPALPLGDSFLGLVHLHGSVLRKPSELVLTDRDFGRAYLTDAWATRFLQRMFDNFTVLFIGYSHDDPIMRYLALGLPSRTSRYVLTHRADDEKWTHLGIAPISYPVSGHDHGAMVAALDAWDQRARMGQLEHRARMQSIVEAGPSLTPVDEDYLKHQLATAEGARNFASFARTTQWLIWMENHPDFVSMFATGQDSETSGVLAHWFGSTYVADPSVSGAALQTVQRLGRRFSSRLYQSACWGVKELSNKDDAMSRRWKVLLATSIDGITSPADLGMLLPYEGSERGEELALIRAAVRPYLTLKRSWLLAGDDPTSSPAAEVAWFTNDRTLTSHLLLAVNDAAPGDSIIGGILEDALASAYELLRAYSGNGNFDGMSFRRSAIEPHSQDRFRDPIDAIIDALRIYGERNISKFPDLPERWWDLEFDLFRRLAVHLVKASADFTPDQRIEWVIERELLFSTVGKHETFALIADSLSGTSVAVRARLLSEALVGRGYPTDFPDADRHKAYGIYNLLVWLTRSDPSWLEAAEAMERLQADHDDFGPREHPDMDHWMSSGTWVDNPPTSADEFIEAAGHDFGTAFSGLVDREYEGRDFGEPTWDGALSLIRQVSERRTDLGIQIWNAAAQQDSLEAKREDLQRAVIGGWERSKLGEHAETVTTSIESVLGVEAHARSITRFLTTQIQAHSDEDESTFTSSLRRIAEGIAACHKAGYTHPETDDYSFLALNSWPGELVAYWVNEVGRRWRNDRDDWTGLDEHERSALEGLLVGPDAFLDATRSAISSDVYFLFAADPSFAETHIIPLFNNEATAAQSWGTYLYHPRYNDRMLGAGFLEATVREWEWLENTARRGLQSQFFGMVVSILTFAGIADNDRRELLNQSVLAAGGSYATDFASSVIFMLGRDGVEPGAVWEHWLKEHVVARLSGLPRIAEPEELARWADLAPLLGRHALEAFALFDAEAIGFGGNYHSPDWPEDLLRDHGAELVSHLTIRMLNSVPTGFSSYTIQEIVTDLEEALGADLCRPLRDAAASRGFYNSL